MKVMHQSDEALLTILQVLLYDPLYSWTVSPQKALLLQRRREAEANDTTVDFDVNSSLANSQYSLFTITIHISAM